MYIHWVYNILLQQFFQDEKEQHILNTYKVVARKGYRCSQMRETITFVKRDYEGQTIEPPSHLLLRLHAACAKVYHLSGAAEVPDEDDEDIEPFRLMSTSFTRSDVNPAAAEALNRALLRLMPVD